MSDQLPAVTRSRLARYGVGSVGTGVFSTVPSVLFLYYGTETLGLAAAALAAVIMLNKAWSIAWDPYVGAWSDGARYRWGRRRPFMAAGALGTGFAFALLFSTPDLGPALSLAWATGAYLALSTFYSLFAVPYSAVPAQISRSTADAARLVSGRMIFVMIGVLAGAALAPMLVDLTGGGRPGYRLMGAALGFASFLVMLPPIGMLAAFDVGDGGPTRRPRFSQAVKGLRRVAQSHRFGWLSLGFLAQATAFGSTSAAIPYVITKGLGRSEADIGMAFGVYLLATIVAVPFWAALARRIGMAKSIGAAAVGFAAGSVAIAGAVSAQSDWSLVLVILGSAGLPFAGLQVLPFTFAADIVRTEAQSDEAKFAGVWTATEKLGLALGAAAFGLTIQSAGSGPEALAVFLAAGPPVLCLLSLLALRAAPALPKG